MSRIGKFIKTESRLVVVRGLWEGQLEVSPDGYEVSLWGDENDLELVVIIAQSCEYTKNQLVVHLKRVDFMIRECLNNVLI